MRRRFSVLRVIPLLACMALFSCSRFARAESPGRFAELRPRTVTICSQNLERYGSPVSAENGRHESKDDFHEKQEALIERFRTAGCDILAVQELMGGSTREAERSLATLSAAMSGALGRQFRGIAGETLDKFIRCAFIFDENKVRLKEEFSFTDIELPKLSEHQRPEFFLRVPLQIVLEVPEGKGAKGARELRLVTFHLKSKTKSFNDPAGLAYETVRMESAEKLRELVIEKNKSALQPGGPVLIILGDRNSDEESASAAILKGRLSLSRFQGVSPKCQVGKGGRPLCRAPVENPKIFTSVLTDDPDTGEFDGTHTYKKRTEWLDEILIPSRNSDAALEDLLRGGDYDSGILWEPRSASDHALVYVRLHF